MEIVIASPQMGTPNALTMTFPSKKGEFDLETISLIFEAANTILDPFYSLCDLQERITEKKKLTGAIDFECELAGMFWLTYFNRSYRDFVGYEKIALLSPKDYSSGGVSVRLGADPTQLDVSTRRDAEYRFGKELFVDPQDESFKRRGAHALRFDQLRREMTNTET